MRRRFQNSDQKPRFWKAALFAVFVALGFSIHRRFSEVMESNGSERRIGGCFSGVRNRPLGKSQPSVSTRTDSFHFEPSTASNAEAVNSIPFRRTQR